MTGWSLRLLSGPGANPSTWGEQSDLTGATAKKISVYLDQPHEISFSMNAEHPEAPLVEELLSDVAAYYDDGTGTGPQRLVRCRVGPSSDTGDGTSTTTMFRALSYRDLLNRKLIYSGDPFEPTPPVTNIEDLGWQMINQAQGRPNGSLGITRGVRDASSAIGGSVSGVEFQVGMVIGEQIDKLFQDAGAYDYDITGNLVYQTYLRPRRTPTNGSRFLLDYGGSVASFQRTVDPSEYANAIIVLGGNDSSGFPIAPEGAEREAPGILDGLVRQGRWEKTFSDPDLTNLERLAFRADRLLSDVQVLQPTYTLTLKPGMWDGPAGLWVGDVCPIRIKAGRLDVDTQLLVTALTFDVGDDGDETVTVSCGGLSPNDAYYKKQRKLLQSIAQLERR